jgi:hypothetical protein
LTKVDLPAPFAPMTVTISPAPTLMLASVTAGTRP